MKVEFRSAKEREPQQEDGMEVLYGPGKRVAFRARWYFIVILVTAPLFWIAFKVFSTLILIESGGKLILPSHEVFSAIEGRVSEIHQEPGLEVFHNQVLVSLDNPQISTRLAELSRLRGIDAGDQRVTFTELERLLSLKVIEADKWKATIKRHLDAGITSETEMQEATTRLIEANQSLLETRLRRDQWSSQQRLQSRDIVSDEALALAQLQSDSLVIRSMEDGELVDVYVRPGQWVIQGEAVARVRSYERLQVWLYIDPKFAAHARIGEVFSIILPNGKKVKGEIVKGADRALKLPNELRRAFSGNEPGLLALAELLEPIGSEWHIEHMPVTARFTPTWIRSLKGLFVARP